MLSCDRQTKPGLVALYDIWPGNGAGPFLQPWSPQRAKDTFNINHEATLTVQIIMFQFHLNIYKLIKDYNKEQPWLSS